MDIGNLSNRTLTLHGAVCGPIWSGAKAGKPISKWIERFPALDVSGERQSLYDMIEDVLCDGDFQHARLSADSVIEIQHRRSSADGRTVTVRYRMVEVAGLPSVAKLVDPDTYTGDFWGG